MEDVAQFENPYHQQFDEWQFLMATNHSLLLYGFGSKRQLLNDFAQQNLKKEGYVLVLDGFDPIITVDAILDLLVQLFLDDLEPAPLYPSLPGLEDEDSTLVTIHPKDPKTGQIKTVDRRKIRDSVERARAIAQDISKAQAKELVPIYLVLHNLEGLRTRHAQLVLSTLVANSRCQVNNNNNSHASANAIRLVASFDQVDTPAVLWSPQTSANYDWIWKQVHTYRPYTKELVMLARDEIQIRGNQKRKAAGGAAGSKKRQPKFLAQEGGGADRVMEVLKNLATRYTEVMHNLANLQLDAQEQQHHQLQQQGSTKVQWIDSAQLLQQCLNTCTVKSDSQLRTFLEELEDHELVWVQKLGSSSVQVRIPYSDEKLHEILAYQPSKN
jgi:origin recognition complex subunit 2